MLIHLHLDEDVTGEYLPSHRTPAPAPDLYLVLGGDHYLEDFISGIREPEALFQVLPDTLFVPRIGMNDIPLFFALRHS
jgi:hypothetical protein